MKISNIKKISGRVLSYIVSRESIITLITCVAVSIIIGACMVYSRKDEDKSIKVGIIYVGDASTAYTDNFIEALADIKEEYGDKVEVMHMYNVAEGTEREYLERLVNAGCNLIFSTSYNYRAGQRAHRLPCAGGKPGEPGMQSDPEDPAGQPRPVPCRSGGLRCGREPAG